MGNSGSKQKEVVYQEEKEQQVAAEKKATIQKYDRQIQQELSDVQSSFMQLQQNESFETWCTAFCNQLRVLTGRKDTFDALRNQIKTVMCDFAHFFLFLFFFFLFK